MTLYKGIQGFSVQNLSADPTDPNEGQLWYNSTSNVWKLTSATTAGAWATGGNLSTARYLLAGAGTQNAGLAIGGNPNLTTTEEYNGTAWTNSSATLSTGRARGGSAGTTAAALYSAGETDSGNSNLAEEYTQGSSTVNYKTLTTS